MTQPVAPLLARALVIASAAFAGACSKSPAIDHAGAVAEWREYGGDKSGIKFSPLSKRRQIPVLDDRDFPKAKCGRRSREVKGDRFDFS